MPAPALPRVGLRADLPDFLFGAGDGGLHASGFPGISSHSWRWEDFCPWQAWRILLVKWGGKAKQPYILSVPRQRLSGRGGKFFAPKFHQLHFLLVQRDQSFPAFCQSWYKVSRGNDGSRVALIIPVQRLVVWFSLESVEFLVSNSGNAEWCMCLTPS